jgi:hypothetical protein
MTTTHDTGGTQSTGRLDAPDRPRGVPALVGRHEERVRSFTDHLVGRDALSLVRRVAPAVGSLLDDELVGALERSLGGVDLTAGWKTCWDRYWAVSDACDRTAADPAASEIVVLARHQVSSAYAAPVDVLVDGAKLCTLAFELRVSGDVVGLNAVVRGGQVIALQGGTVTAEARLLLGDAVLDTWSFTSDVEVVVDLPGPAEQEPRRDVPGQRAGQ